MTNIDAGSQRIRRLPDKPIVGETYPNAGGIYKVDRYDAERDLAWVHRPKDGWKCCAHGPALYDVPGRGMRYEGALRSPIYDLCRQTVTVYHACYNPFRVTRCVIHGAYFERKTVQTVDKSGGKSCDEFLLVIPNKNARRVAPALFNGIPGVYVLECGDRIVEGVGEEITTREQWGSFVPTNRPGVVTADWVRDMGCRNVLYHVEAGGKQ